MDLLCEYSDSSENECDNVEPPTVKKARHGEKLPVPTQIQSMFNSQDVHNNILPADEPCKHQNRVRRFPHVRGNWATCLFAELKPHLIEDLRTLQNKLFKALESSEDLEVKISPELHMSVSRTVTFQLQWIELFLRKITKEIGLKISRFSLYWLPELKIFLNDDKTRTFVGLCVRNDGELRKVVNIIDKELEELKLEPFYNPPHFHVSLLWCLGNKEQELTGKLACLNEALSKCMEDGTLEDGGYSQTVHRIVCKTGNKTFHVDISNNR